MIVHIHFIVTPKLLLKDLNDADIVYFLTEMKQVKKDPNGNKIIKMAMNHKKFIYFQANNSQFDKLI